MNSPPESLPTLDRIASYYEILGVAPDATSAEIRVAYLARAREHHPDVARADQRASSTSMAELNRAYEVLRRQATRDSYDRELRSTQTVAEPGDDAQTGARSDQSDDDVIRRPPGSRLVDKVVSPSGPARMPWRMMGVAAVVGTVIVLVSAAFVTSPEDEPPDGILRVGSCVAVEPNSDVREIACGPDAELVVRLLIPTDGTCPPAYMPHRDRLGLGTACVEALPGGE